MPKAYDLAQGTGYTNAVQGETYLQQFQIARPFPGDDPQFEELIVRASRVVDMLPFEGESDLESRQFIRYQPPNPGVVPPDPGDDVPYRVAAAVAIIAATFPPDGAQPTIDRLPQAVGAGSVNVRFEETGDAIITKSDDRLMADRYGLADVRAYRLLRPFLADLDFEPQAEKRGGSGGTYVSVVASATATSF